MMVPVDPGGTLGFEHDTGAEFGQVHVPPPVVDAITDVNVVLAGVASDSVAALQ